MFAEISVHFKRPVAPQVLFNGVFNTDVATALSQTTFANSPELVGAAACASIRPSSAYVIFALGAQLIQIHVENTTDRSSLSKLKLVAAEAVQVVLDVAKANNVKPDTVQVKIHAEYNLICKGRYEGAVMRILHRLLDTILGDLLIAGASGVLALLLLDKHDEAWVVIVGAVVAFLLWLIVEAIFIKPELTYVDT